MAVVSLVVCVLFTVTMLFGMSVAGVLLSLVCRPRRMLRRRRMVLVLGTPWGRGKPWWGHRPGHGVRAWGRSRWAAGRAVGQGPGPGHGVGAGGVFVSGSRLPRPWGRGRGGDGIAGGRPSDGHGVGAAMAVASRDATWGGRRWASTGWEVGPPRSLHGGAHGAVSGPALSADAGMQRRVCARARLRGPSAIRASGGGAHGRERAAARSASGQHPAQRQGRHPQRRPSAPLSEPRGMGPVPWPPGCEVVVCCWRCLHEVGAETRHPPPFGDHALAHHCTHMSPP